MIRELQMRKADQLLSMKPARIIMIALLRVRRLQKPVSNDSLDIKKSDDNKPTTTESEFEKPVEEEIEQARSELTNVVLAKQKEVVCRMGEALEKIRKGEKRHSICEELKNRLREEIARRIISEKTIENYCKPEWKNPQKSRSGKKGASGKNRLSPSSSTAEKLSATLEIREERREDENSEKTREQAILVNTNGIVDPMSDDLTNYIAASPIGNNSLKYEKELDELSKPSSAQKTKTMFRNPTSSPDYREFEFWLPFEEVENEMKRRFAEQGNAAKIWFNGIIDASTGKVITANVGRINEPPDENELSDTGNQ